MPIKKIKRMVTERIRLQKLKREHSAYLEHSPPRQFRLAIAEHGPETAKNIEELARKTQARLVSTVIAFKYTEEERAQLEEIKGALERIYPQMEEIRRKRLIAAALNMKGHGPPYEDLAKHIIELAKRYGHI